MVSNRRLCRRFISLIWVATLALVGCSKSPEPTVSPATETTANPATNTKAADASATDAGAPAERDYLKAAYDPMHFKPAIDQATNAQCLACHAEVIAPSVSAKSPAGVDAASVKAWYQRTSTYKGEQDTFHRRHLETPMAKELMSLACNTCHQGHDPRDEVPGSSATSQQGGYNLRKLVETDKTCLKCHGTMNYQVMGLPAPWHESGKTFQNNCLICHAAIRTGRHKVNYLKADAIEEAAKKDPETCYGCHGGRAWYRIHYPYPRTPWTGMPEGTPDWAKDRPTQSESRFLKSSSASTAAK